MKGTTRTRSFITPFTVFLFACLCILGAALASAASAETIQVSKSGNIEIWTIRQPVINQPITRYSQIVVRQGDTVTITSGGCAQPGGSIGLTWKRYVDPRAASPLDPTDTWQLRPFDNKHYGQVYILGITDKLQGANMGWVNLKDIQGRPLIATLPTSELQLGYKDDRYDDNGYSGHNDGPAMQCKGVEDAWVRIEIERSTLNNPQAGSPGSTNTSGTNTGGANANTGTPSAPAKDTTMPQLVSFYTNPAGFSYQGGGIGVYVTASDNVAVQGVTLTLFKPDGTKSGIRLQKSGGTLQNSQWTTSWTVPMNTSAQPLTYGLKVDVVDSSGNILYGQQQLTFTVAGKTASGPIGQPTGTSLQNQTAPFNPQTPANSIQNSVPLPKTPVMQPSTLQNSAAPTVK